MIKRILSITILTTFIIIPLGGILLKGLDYAQACQRKEIKVQVVTIREELKIGDPIPARVAVAKILPTPTPALKTTKPHEVEEVIVGVIEMDEWVDPPETVYNYYTDQEIDWIHRLVEAEATGGTIDDKINVAHVIFNRLFSDNFPDTVKGVVFHKVGRYYQFSPIPDGRFYEVEVTDDTVKAVEYAFSEHDTTKGALYFCNMSDVRNLRAKKWFGKLKYIMTDDLGHSYYK